MPESKSSLHLEFDDDGRPIVRRLEGEIPENTKLHLQSLLGWTMDDAHRQAGDKPTDVFEGSPPYLKQDAGMAGNADIQTSPPRIVPPQMEGHPGVQQGEAEGPISIYNLKDIHKDAHVLNPGGATPILSTMGDSDNPEEPLVTPAPVVSSEDVRKFQELKAQIAEAANVRDYTALRDLKRRFMQLKGEFEGKIDDGPELDTQQAMAEVVSDSPNPGGKPETAIEGGVPEEQLGGEALVEASKETGPPRGFVDAGQAIPKLDLDLKEEPPQAIEDLLQELDYHKDSDNIITDKHPLMEAIRGMDRSDAEGLLDRLLHFSKELQRDAPDEFERGLKIAADQLGFPHEMGSVEGLLIKSRFAHGGSILGRAKDQKNHYGSIAPGNKTVGQMHRPAGMGGGWRTSSARTPQYESTSNWKESYDALQPQRHMAPWGRPPRANHKYIRRWWKNDHWEYEYAEKPNQQHKQRNGVGRNAMESSAHAWDIHGRSKGNQLHDHTIEIPEKVQDALKVDKGNGKTEYDLNPVDAYQKVIEHHKSKGGEDGGLDALTWVDRTDDGRYHVFRQTPDRTRETFSRTFNDKQLNDFLERFGEKNGLDKDDPEGSILSKKFRSLPEHVLFPSEGKEGFDWGPDREKLFAARKKDLGELEHYKNLPDDEREEAINDDVREWFANPYKVQLGKLRNHVLSTQEDRADLRGEENYDKTVDYDVDTRNKPKVVRDGRGNALFAIIHRPHRRWEDVITYHKEDKTGKEIQFDEDKIKSHNLSKEDVNKLANMRYRKALTKSQYEGLMSIAEEGEEDNWKDRHDLSKRDYQIRFFNDDLARTRKDLQSKKYRQTDQGSVHVSFANAKEAEKAGKYLVAMHHFFDHVERNKSGDLTGKPFSGTVPDTYMGRNATGEPTEKKTSNFPTYYTRDKADSEYIFPRSSEIKDVSGGKGVRKLMNMGNFGTWSDEEWGAVESRNPLEKRNVISEKEFETLPPEEKAKFSHGSMLYKAEMGMLPYRYVGEADEIPTEQMNKKGILPEGWDDWHQEKAVQIRPDLNEHERSLLMREMLASPTIQKQIKGAAFRAYENPHIKEMLSSGDPEDALEELVQHATTAAYNMLVIQRNPSHPRTYAMGYIPGVGKLGSYLHKSLYHDMRDSGWFVRGLMGNKEQYKGLKAEDMHRVHNEIARGDGEGATSVFDLTPSQEMSAEERLDLARNTAPAVPTGDNGRSLAEEAADWKDEGAGENFMEALYRGTGKRDEDVKSPLKAHNNPGEYGWDFDYTWDDAKKENPQAFTPQATQFREGLTNNLNTFVHKEVEDDNRNPDAGQTLREVGYFLNEVLANGLPDVASYWDRPVSPERRAKPTFKDVVDATSEFLGEFYIPKIGTEELKETAKNPENPTRGEVRSYKEAKLKEQAKPMVWNWFKMISPHLTQVIDKLRQGAPSAVVSGVEERARFGKGLESFDVKRAESILKGMIESAFRQGEGLRGSVIVDALQENETYQTAVDTLIEARHREVLKSLAVEESGSNELKKLFLVRAINALHGDGSLEPALKSLNENVTKSLGEDAAGPEMVRLLAMKWYKGFIKSDSVERTMGYLDNQRQFFLSSDK